MKAADGDSFRGLRLYRFSPFIIIRSIVLSLDDKEKMCYYD